MSRMTMIALLLVIQGAMIWNAGASLLSALLPAMLVVVRQLLRFPDSWGRRTWFCFSAFWIVSTTWLSLVMPVEVSEVERLVRVSLCLRLANILLFCQALLAFQQGKRPRIHWVLPSLVLVTTFLIFTQSLLPSQKPLLIGLSIALVLVFGLSFQSRETAKTVDRTSRSSARIMTLAIVFLLVGLGTYGVATALERGVTSLQTAIQEMFSSAAGFTRPSLAYVRSGTLESVTLAKQTDPMNVALRVYADRAPGYLRGRVFDTYREQQWILLGERRRARSTYTQYVARSLASIPNEIPEPRKGRNLFALAESPVGPFVKMEIHNDPRRGNLCFIPLNASYLEAVGSYASGDHHHVIRNGLDLSVPYTAYVPRLAKRTELSDAMRERLLAPLPVVTPRIKRIVASLENSGSSPAQRIEAVASFFQDNFEYSPDGLDLPEGEEPVSYFIENRSPAHCELFASGAIALLRELGVPARYVTGYVAIELEDEYEEYWLARNRNAHAWVEAFDEQRGRWVLVEPTPGMQIGEDDQEFRRGSGDGDAAEFNGQDSRNRSRSFAGIEIELALQIVMAIALLVGSAWIAIVLVPTRGQKRFDRTRDDQAFAAMKRRLLKMDRLLAKHGLCREPQETLHQFSIRLTQHVNGDQWIVAVAEWYRRYAEHRYAGLVFDKQPPRRSSKLRAKQR